MSQLNEVLHITKDLDKLLEEEVTAKNREQMIARINELIEKRGQLLEHVRSPYSKEEHWIGKQIVALNSNIQKKLDYIFKELKLEMKQMNKQKKSTKTYENPYKSVQTMDGMFLDRKK